MVRYIVKMEYYLLADNDQQSIEEAELTAKLQRELQDDSCDVVSIYRKNFGSRKTIKIK